MVDLGKTEIFKRQMAQSLQRLSDSDFAPLYAFEKFFQFLGVHGLIGNRVGHDRQAGMLWFFCARLPFFEMVVARCFDCDSGAAGVNHVDAVANRRA